MRNMNRNDLLVPSRRSFIALGGSFLLASRADARDRFEQWARDFRTRALTRVSAATYDRVMLGLKPDTTVFEAVNSQPEFTEELWQYINRRCSDWRVITGKERATEYASVLQRVEAEYGVDRYIMLGVWGMESSYGDVIVNRKYMRPIIPALATLAWGEARRRHYWEAELLNALTIVERGWAQPSDMIGSWAGAMGHTQWMPEVWLHMGVDFDHDGHISPFGKPDDALAGTARFLVERGGYRRGEAWGHEVMMPNSRLAQGRWRSYAEWQSLGVRRANGNTFPRPNDRARLWIPVDGGPAFLVGQNFRAVHSYNPSQSYTLALCHLGDLIRGDNGFHRQFPGSERIPTIDEVKEIQRRLNERGFKTDGIDGRTGSDTVRAVAAFQKKVGMSPADGYVGLKVLARLRQPN